MSLAKGSGGYFSRAFLNQVELGRSQPSTRVLRVIAGRLGTEVDYLLEGKLPNLYREVALERARVLMARGPARRALPAVGEAAEASDWPIRTDARLCRAEVLRALGRAEEADAILAEERQVIAARKDGHRLERLRALERGEAFSIGRGNPDTAVRVHLPPADPAVRAGENQHPPARYPAPPVPPPVASRTR